MMKKFSIALMAAAGLMISANATADEALAKAKSSYGRFEDGVKFINPRHE